MCSFDLKYVLGEWVIRNADEVFDNIQRTCFHPSCFRIKMSMIK